MSLPKRPFTTSSLTSSLKSTIASQPLLSNLTNIDKLSSQASSFAQKTPFFGSFNHHNPPQAQPQPHPTPAQNSHPLPLLQSQQENQLQHHSPQHNAQHHPSHSPNSNPIDGSVGTDMMRSSGSAGQANAGGQPRPPTASTPAVDLSHLTEEERLMIQSVMAKAEMADMGIPVDTSAPSSTNLPSQTSQALTQQTKMQLQNRQQVNQAAQMNPNISQQQQQHQQQMQHLSQPNSMQYQQQQPINVGMDDGTSRYNQVQQNSSIANQIQQPYNQIQQQNNLSHQQGYQQGIQGSQMSQQQPNSNDMQFDQVRGLQSQSMIDSSSTLPQIEQQTQQLINQINSQFHLGDQSQQNSHQQNLSNRQAQQQASPRNLNQQFMTQPQQQLQTQHQQLGPLQVRPQLLTSANSFDQSTNSQMQNQGLAQQQSIDRQFQPYQQSQQQSQIQNQQNIVAAAMNQQNAALQTNQMFPMELMSGNQEHVGVTQPNPMAGFQAQQQAQQSLALGSQRSNIGDYSMNQNANQRSQNVDMRNVQADIGINSQSNLANQALDPCYVGQQMQSDLQMIPTGSMNQPLAGRYTTSGEAIQRFDADPQNQGMGYSHDPHSQAKSQLIPQDSYQSSRSNVQFVQQPLQSDRSPNNQALSDQEQQNNRPRRGDQYSSRSNFRRYDSADLSEDRNSKRGKRLATKNRESDNDKSLQAYDLARRNPQETKIRAKSRKLPQPNQTPERSASSSNAPQGSNRRQTVNDPMRPIDHPYLSESEEDELDNEEEYASSPDLKAEISSRKSPNPTPKEQQSADKSEEALRLIGELKLAEQANQVMEQQQLLIKQSQELIKLQLEQQALSQELKKSIQRQAQTPTDKDDQSSKITDSAKGMNDGDHQSAIGREADGEESSRETNEKSSDVRRGSVEERILSRGPRLETNKKSMSFTNERDSDLEDSPRISSKSVSHRFEDLNSSTTRFNDETGARSIERDRIVKKPSTTMADSSAQTYPSPRYNRDVLQSPTDTTDSDIEPSSHSNLRRHQKLNQTKAKGVIRRREPTGLPPSPLPVAAAIQLHQMQQQHYKQNVSGSKVSNLSRANFMRSRSVTSSPNHQLEALNSGYLTDNQRVRSVSPDTLSEFGGQRRRKRLPEPPQNAVPLTPSMVRKMIQAQRAGSTSGKLSTSVNAQSTLFSNAYTNRISALERHPVDSRALSRSSLHNESQVTSTVQNFQTNPVTPTADPIPAGSQTTVISTQKPSATATADLDRFLSSTYGREILRNNVSDVDETPELDKLISNLDDYYGLDGKRHVRISQTVDTNSFDPYCRGALRGLLSAANLSISPSRMAGQSYNSAVPPTKLPYSDHAPLTRCNSEGENSLTSRLARRQASNIDSISRVQGRPTLTNSLFTERRPYLGSSPLGTSPLISSDLSKDQPSNLADRLSSNLSSRYPSQYRQVTSQSSPIHRLHTSTTSFDGGNIEHLHSGNHADTRGSGYIADVMNYGSRYQPRYPSPLTNFESTRDKYRYSAIQDLSKYDRYEPSSSSSRLYGSRMGAEVFESRRYNPSDRYNLSNFQQKSFDLDTRRSTQQTSRSYLSTEQRARESRTGQYSESIFDQPSYLNDPMGSAPSPIASSGLDHSHHTTYPGSTLRHSGASSSFTPLTKDDIINNGPKFNSIGYRFRTENQNKYVSQARTPTQFTQARYPYPYKRILLSKNPKDRIGNGIGLRITGGQPMANLYDKANKNLITSGAFVTEVFQNSNVYFMGEIHEGDQIIEWNGVNLSNRSNEEVQQILLSQFSDDEVDIVYLSRDKFPEAYDEAMPDVYDQGLRNYDQSELSELYTDMMKTDPLAKSRYSSSAPKGNIRRKLSLSSFTNMWSR